MTKKCPSCNLHKDLTSFHKSRTKGLFGLKTYCIDCSREKLELWRRSNRDKVRLQCRRYYYKYVEKNRQRVLDWEKANPELNRKGASVYFHRRRANGKITRKVLDSVYQKYSYKCVYCKTSDNLSLDHIKPVSLGGDNSFNNLQVLCMTHNLSKGNRERPYAQ